MTAWQRLFEGKLTESFTPSGEEASLIESYRPRLLYFALRRLRDRTAAEEVAQDTLIIVLEALRENRLRDPANLPGFVFGVARNLVLKALRERGRDTSSESVQNERTTSTWIDDPDAGLLLEEQRRQVREALAELSQADQDILQRTFVTEQTPEEIALELGIPYATLRKRKSRALERLKKVFQNLSQKG